MDDEKKVAAQMDAEVVELTARLDSLRDAVKGIGFKEAATNITVMNSLVYDLGRDRFLILGSLGTPNEMLFIGERDGDAITDLVSLRNFDYDGYTGVEDIKRIITAITGRVFDEAVSPDWLTASTKSAISATGPAGARAALA